MNQINLTQEEIKRLKSALLKFGDAYIGLVGVLCEINDANDIIAEKYPFDKSFDELDVESWMLSCIMKMLKLEGANR